MVNQERAGAIIDELRKVVGELVADADQPIAPEDNLVERGLDSIAMMRLASRYRHTGYAIGFADLAAEPTLAAWAAVLERSTPADSDLTAARSPAEAPVEYSIETSTEDPIENPVEDPAAPFPLAEMQHAYWVGRDRSQVLGGVAAHFYHEFAGRDVDPDRLERAVRALFARHAMLRVRITDDGRQFIGSEPAWRGLTVHDHRHRSAAEAEAALLAVRDRLSHRMLDIDAGEVFDISLSLLPDGDTRLHINLDMVAADAVSFRTLLADLAQLYTDPQVSLPPIGYSFREYREAVPGTRAPAHEADRAWWLDRLPDLPGPPELPTTGSADGGAPGFERPRVARRHHWLDGARLAAFSARARAHRVTPAMALATCFGEVLAGFTARPRFLLNLPMFGREPLHPDVDLLVGDFTSSLLLEFDATAPATFAERVAATQHRFRTDAAHAAYTGVEVLRDLSRHHGRQVVAPVVLTSALNLGELYTEQFRRCFGSPCWIVSQGPQVWLDAQLTELDGGLLTNWDAVEQAFPVGMLDAMFGAFRELVEALADGQQAWSRPVGPLLPAPAREVRERRNDTGEAGSGLLHAEFFTRAAAEPGRPAVCWGDGGWTGYGELAQRALRIAGDLVAAGVAPGDHVAVHLPKGPAQIEAVLGVLAAGAAYVPIGVDQPPARRARICRSANVAMVLTATPDDAGWPDHVARRAPAAGDAPRLPEPVARHPDDTAYVLCTSGSTGEPKAVVVPHRAAYATIDDLADRLAIGPELRTLAISALDFDLSVYDVFAPLMAGGAVVVPDESQRRDAAAWRLLCHAHGVTVVNCVPALLDMLLAAGPGDGPDGDGALDGLRAVLLGGDWVGLDLPDRLAAQAPGCRFVALGGTTETAIHSTWCEVDQVAPHWRSIPYGVPLRGVALRVVDRHGRDCPDLVAGELWIGGAGVADGYLGDPDRTAAAFVTVAGRRWYRTGDLARYHPDGVVEFLGRADAQVKVRGHRIELGEIESALERHPTVARAVAGVVPGPAARIAAAVTGSGPTDAPGSPDPVALREWLRAELPGPMVPDLVIPFDDLPLSANGKIDRPRVRTELARRTADAPAPAGPRTPPTGDLERTVAAGWALLLGLDDVAREDDFFTLGGDSLVATRLLQRLRADGVRGASIGALFAAPVLADFAAGLRRGTGPATTRTIVADPAARYEPFAPTPVQAAYWVGRTAGMTLGGIGCHFYREYDVTDLDLDRLRGAIAAVVARHDALRTVFDRDGNQRVLAEVGEFPLLVRDGGDAERARLRAELSHRVFDPARWPLFSVGVVRDGRQARLAIGLDNIVLDALSVLLFYSELATCYADPGARLPEIGLTFRDYLHAAQPEPAALEEARRYWRDRLPQLPPAPQLPLAVDPAAVERPRFTRREALVDRERWAALRAKARDAGLTPSVLLLTTFSRVLAAWSARPDLTVNVTLFDRQELHPDITRVMGDFTSLVLVEHDAGGQVHWLDAARRTQRDLSRGLDHRAVSAVWVQRELGRIAGDPELTVPVVFTSALGVGAEVGAEVGGLLAEQVFGISQTPQVWLDHQVTEVDGGVALHWDAVAELFPPGALDAMFGAYLDLIDHLAAAEWTAELPDPLPAEQRAVRDQVNDTGWQPPQTLLHDAVFRRAAEDPAAPAILWGTGPQAASTSRGELADRALRIAALLARAGVRSGEPVAVTVPKGPDQVAALLGVLAAGGAYVPIGVDQPPARRRTMLRNAGARVTLAGGGSTEPLDGRIDGVTVLDLADADGVPPIPAPVPVSPDKLAYVIFTSGSTGEPKGVEITHRAAANTVADLVDRFGLGREDRVLAVSAYDFDLSVFDVFGLLGAGGGVVLVEEDARREARRWLELVGEHRVTVWNTVPALLDMLLVVAEGAGPGRSLGSLRLALASGDWVGLDLPGRLRAAAPDSRFVALGGATEAAIWSNAQEVGAVDPAWRSIPYGLPLRGQRFRVTDHAGRDRPDWVAGELWIGGTGVALGYRGDPARTAASFVGSGADRWYRTGDNGRYWPDGTLEFLGRTDHQVKLGGHRIELGEVEAALTAAPGVGHAVATVAGEGPARQLVAAVVPATAPAVAPSVVARGADDAQARAAVVEHEALAAEAALVGLLGLDRAAGFGGLDGTAAEHRPVVRRWLRWLTGRRVLTDDGGPGARLPEAADRPAPVSTAAALADRAHARLLERADDYRAILAGRADPRLLLDDPVLAPERLADADPARPDAIGLLVTRITAAATAARGRVVEVVEPAGRSGLTARRLVEALIDELGADRIRYTVLDPSPAMVAAAAAHLDGLPSGTYECRVADRVPEPDLRYRFDVVVADNALHRHADPAHGLHLAMLLLRPGGLLAAVERDTLTPIAMLTAGLLDPAADGLLDGPRWADVAATAGFAEVESGPVAGAPLNVLFGRRRPDAVDVSADGVLAALRDRLPAHMRPQQVAVLAWLPLTANGKVDREAVARLAAGTTATAEQAGREPEADDADAALRDDTERFVAQVWGELLLLPVVSRSDDFIALGGDSMLATRFLERLRGRFGVTLTLRRMFENPTVAAVSAALTEVVAHTMTDAVTGDEIQEGVL